MCLSLIFKSFKVLNVAIAVEAFSSWKSPLILGFGIFKERSIRLVIKRSVYPIHQLRQKLIFGLYPSYYQLSDFDLFQLFLSKKFL